MHVFIAAHIAHWLMTGSTLSPLEPSEAMELSKHGVVNAGLVLFLAAIVSTALFGRFFCGWACHLVALQDLSRWILLRFGIRPRPLRSRLLALVPAIAFVYMFIWPTAYRLWIGDDLSRLETAYTTTGFWDTFPGWTIGILTFVICGGLIVFFLGSKGFCTYACPYGAILGAAERFAPTRIRVTDACRSCASCTAACTSNVRVHEEVRDHGMVVDSGCMKCLDCVAACPNEALYLGFGKPSLAALGRSRTKTTSSSLPWSSEVFLALAFAAALFTFRGLYGTIPFLMALGLAGILALWALTLWRLTRAPDVRLGPVLLRSQGRLREAGKTFLVLSVPVCLLWVHSALVHVETARGETSYRQVAPALRAYLDIDHAWEPVTGALLEEAHEGSRRLTRADDWGLAPHPRIDLELAWLALAQGDMPGLRDRIARSLSNFPELAAAHLLAARLFVQDRNPAEASKHYAKTIELDPGQTPAFLGLGVLLARAQDLEGSLRVFEQGLVVHPNSPDLNYNAGLAEAMLGRPDPAIERFERALELDPEHVAARENLMGLKQALGR